MEIKEWIGDFSDNFYTLFEDEVLYFGCNIPTNSEYEFDDGDFAKL